MGQSTKTQRERGAEGSMRSHHRAGANQKRHRERANATLTCCCKDSEHEHNAPLQGSPNEGEVEPKSSHKEAVLSLTTCEAPSPWGGHGGCTLLSRKHLLRPLTSHRKITPTLKKASASDWRCISLHCHRVRQATMVVL